MVGDEASDYTKAVRRARSAVGSHSGVVVLEHELKDGEFVQDYGRPGRYIYGPCVVKTSCWVDGGIEQEVSRAS